MIYAITDTTSQILQFYNEVENLLTEINTSGLINEDKLLLKNRLSKAIIDDYIIFIEELEKNKTPNPLLPMYVINEEIVNFTTLEQTIFGIYYKKFRSKLTF